MAALTEPSPPIQPPSPTRRLRGLWQMMTGFRFTYLTATLALGVAALTKTATYLLLRRYVDQVLGKGEAVGLLPWIALGFVALACFEGAFTYVSGRLAARTAEGVTRRLRDRLFDHIQRLPFAYHDRSQTGDLVERVTSDVDALRRFFADQAITAGRILLLFAVNFAALAALHLRLALFSVTVVPVIVAVSVVFFRRVTRAYEAYQEQEARLTTTLQENLSGVRVVKAFARQAYEIEKFDRDNWEKFRRGRHLLAMHSFFWPASDILCGLQMLAGFYLAARTTIAGSISLGTYLAYAGMVVWLIWPMRNLARLIVQMSTGLVSYGRVAEVLREPPEPSDAELPQPPGDLRGEVVFRKVSFSYGGHRPALHDISFACRPGQVVALLGPTGSGKSSLVNLLPRFYEYTGGSLTIDGIELRRYPRTFLRRQIGIVEQEPFLFSRTLRENIAYGVERAVSQEEVEAAARAAAIHEVIVSFPAGYETLVGEKGVTLSGGQKQRIAIARTLLKNPRILILDDSTSSVDIETEDEIRQALAELMRGRTTFIIAHRIQSLMQAHLILVLDQGRIVQRGTHAELINQPGIYRQIYSLQSRIETEVQQEIDRVAP